MNKSCHQKQDSVYKDDCDRRIYQEIYTTLIHIILQNVYT